MNPLARGKTATARDVVTVWVLGNQLHRRLGALGSADPYTHRVLMVESRASWRRGAGTASGRTW